MENIPLPDLLTNKSRYFSLTYAPVPVNVIRLDTGITW